MYCRFASHEAHRSLVADRGYLVHSDMRPWHLQRCSFSLTGVTATGVVIRSHTDLVGPKDLRLFPGRLFLDSWVRLFQPLLDLVGLLLTRMPRWLLGSVTPASQVLPDRSFRHLDVELLADQVAHRATSPQCLSNAQLLRGVMVDQFLDALGLRLGQQASRAQRSTGTIAGQRRQAIGRVSSPPATDGLMADTQKFSEVHLGVAQFDATQGTHTQNRQGFSGQLAGIWQLDRHDDSPSLGFDSFCCFHSPSELVEQLSCRGKQDAGFGFFGE